MLHPSSQRLDLPLAFREIFTSVPLLSSPCTNCISPETSFNHNNCLYSHRYLLRPQSRCPAIKTACWCNPGGTGTINNCVPCAPVRYHSDLVFRHHRSIKTDGGRHTDCECTAINQMLQLQCRNPDIYGWGAYLSEGVAAWVLTVVRHIVVLMLTCPRCASARASPSNQNRFLSVSERIHCG